MKRNKSSDLLPHSERSHRVSQDYHGRIVDKPSGVSGDKIIARMNPTRTLPEATAINTETMGPG